MHGFGDDHHIALQQKPQGDLGHGFAVLGPHRRQNRVGEEILPPLGKGAPGLMDDAILLHDGMGRLLLVQGVGFHLVYHGANLHELAQVHQTVGEEVGDPNGPDLPSLVGLFHGPPGAIVVVEGLVDEQQVNVVGVQPLQCLFHSIRLLVEGRPQLGFQKNLLSGHAGLLHCTTYGLFIDIGVCRVDQAIAIRQHIEDGCFRLVRGQKKGSNTCHRHLNSIVQSNIFHY